MLIGDVEYLKPSAGYDWKCRRCGHQWCYRGPRMADPEPPAQCAGCRSAYWNRPKSGKSGKVIKKSGPKLKLQSTSYPIDAPMTHPLLAPPPHLRAPSYFPPEPEPAPENMITKPDDTIGNGTDNTTAEEPDEPPQNETPQA